MPTKSMKPELRQLVGAAVFAATILILVASHVSPLDDWNGSLGLALSLALGLLAPRKWLAPAFLVVASFFLAVGCSWLLLDIRGQAKSPLYWMAFLFTAAIMLIGAWLTVRSNRANLRHSATPIGDSRRLQ
jgi:hypothetical protein